MPRTPEQIYDEWLVLQCRDGRVKAFERLVERWKKRLYSHAWRLTGKHDAAADVLQEAWIAVVKGIRRLDDPGRLRSWLYRIVTFKAADWIRRERKQRGLKSHEARSEEPSSDNTFRNAIRRLPEDCRAILALFYLEELSVREIAHVLDIPAGTVKSRLFYARKELKRRLP